MALNSTLGSPGIEIREIDNSIRIDANTSTTVFVPGYASQGPVEEVMSIGSLGDFELIYGKPSNGAERYFYYTVKALLDKGGSGIRVLTSRLPYGAGAGDGVSDAYTLLAYPAVPVIKSNSGRDTDCFIATDDKLPTTFATLSGTDAPTLNTELSTYEIHVEEDYLNDSEISVEQKLNIGIDPSYTDSEGNEKTAMLPLLTDTTAIAPTLSAAFAAKTTGSEPTNTLNAEGHIATEVKDGKLLVHLVYSLFDSADTKKIAPVGYAIFKLVYDIENYSTFEAKNINQFGISESSIETTFAPAYEIAVSYDGQSEKQLGNWSFKTKYD